MAEVHITFKGQTADLDIEELGINRDMGNDQIVEILANHFDRDVDEMREYEIEWQADGGLIVRPPAELG